MFHVSIFNIASFEPEIKSPKLLFHYLSLYTYRSYGNLKVHPLRDGSISLSFLDSLFFQPRRDMEMVHFFHSFQSGAT